jgi:hypothetical protein
MATIVKNQTNGVTAQTTIGAGCPNANPCISAVQASGNNTVWFLWNKATDTAGVTITTSVTGGGGTETATQGTQFAFGCNTPVAGNYMGCGCTDVINNVYCGLDTMAYRDCTNEQNYCTWLQYGVLQDQMFGPATAWSGPEHLFLVSEWIANCTNTTPGSCSVDTGVNTFYAKYASLNYITGAPSGSGSMSLIFTGPFTGSPHTVATNFTVADTPDTFATAQAANLSADTTLATAGFTFQKSPFNNVPPGHTGGQVNMYATSALSGTVVTQSHTGSVGTFTQSFNATNPTPVTSVTLDTKTQDLPGNFAWTDMTYMFHQLGISWNYYHVPGSSAECLNPNTLSCITGSSNVAELGGSIWNPLEGFATVISDGETGNVQHVDGFYSNTYNSTCTLPQVTWVTPASALSDHPAGSMKDGQAYATALINAVEQGPCWANSAIFLVWDDWGGYYDHVQPPTVQDGLGYGLRVAAMMISPYARAGMIDHNPYSFDAFNRFIEDLFPALNHAGPGNTAQRLDPSQLNWGNDSRALIRDRPSAVVLTWPDGHTTPMGNLMCEFDFTQTPIAPIILNNYP